MRRNSTPSLGAFHPVIFFTLVYGISLFLAIFVCRTVYYSMNDENNSTSSFQSELQFAGSSMSATASK